MQGNMQYRLGKKPARTGAVKLRLMDYVDKTVLPRLPSTFGHDTIIGKQAWGMLGNDHYGDCFWAMAAHGLMQLSTLNGEQVTFSANNVLAAYGAGTGFKESDPNTDQGTDMQEGLKFLQDHGMKDSSGRTHKVRAYLALEPGNLEDLWYSMLLTDGAAVGIEFPQSAMDQFNAGKPWSVARGSSIEGGHAIWMNSRMSRSAGLVTWGAETSMTLPFYEKYNDETDAVLFEDTFKNGKAPIGLDIDQLLADLNEVKST